MPTVKELHGFLPTSVWNLDKRSSFNKFIKDNGDSENTRRGKNSWLPNLKYSEFNSNLAERIIKYWSNEDDVIVDPFSGRATRAVVSINLCRFYYGYEISPKTYEVIMQRLKENNDQKRFNKMGAAVIYLADGCKMKECNNDIADLIFTCPPYHRLERYESVDGQLSELRKYEDFLTRIDECLHNCYRVLKQNKFCIWVVSDWRDNGFKCFHSDCIDLAIKNGFVLWDIIINVLNSPFLSFKAGDNDKQKYTGKTHEYVLVFKKSGDF